MKKILEVKNLTFSYDNSFLLKDINLDVYENDFLALIGPNGGGKTTLLKLMLRLLKPKSGYVSKIKDLAYVPQITSFNRNFPIKTLDVVLMGFLEKKLLFSYNKNQINKAKEALDKLGLLGKMNKKIGELSGGERQKVLLARAIVKEPKILFLDEPTSNIDLVGQKFIYKLLQDLNLAIVVVSHDISLILKYAKNVAFINKSLVYHKLNDNLPNIGDEHFCEIELLNSFENKGY